MKHYHLPPQLPQCLHTHALTIKTRHYLVSKMLLKLILYIISIYPVYLLGLCDKISTFISV